MQVSRGLDGVAFNAKSVVTIGTFDGMHLGHQAIVGELLAARPVPGGRTVVVTFDPHPKRVVGDAPVGLLTTIGERIELLRRAGVDLVCVVEFTYEFSRQPASLFFEQYVIKGTGVAGVVVGDDHMFGRDREASIGTLREMGTRSGFPVTTVDPVTLSGSRISSSAIRRMLSGGDVEAAGRCLGRDYSMTATVVRGDGRGAMLGFPTANLAPESAEKVVPAGGVYLGWVEASGIARNSMINIGTRPTFGTGGPAVIEAHIIGWNGDLYGRPVVLGFRQRIRDEKKFSNAAELAAQLERDRAECLRRTGPAQ